MPPKGYFRLFPGNKVRLRYGYVIECTGADKDENGNIVAVHCNYFPDSRSGTEGANNYKVKGNIHWVSAASRVRGRSAPLRPPVQGTATGRGRPRFPRSAESRTRSAWSTPISSRARATRTPEQRYQFERHGYFVADRVDSQPGKPVFNRIVSLRDSWGKPA